MKVNFQNGARLFIATAFILAGCATAPGQPDLGSKLKQTFASEDPCANNARNIGILSGAVVGALLGNATGNGQRDNKIVGMALGSIVGGLMGADIDRKRCELSKIAKQYDLDIVYSSIETSAPNSTVSESPKAILALPTPGAVAVIGNSVTVREKEGRVGHFESGSDQLTPKAQEYFSAIATQYAPQTLLAAQPDAKGKTEMLKQLEQRRIFLVGHTDDTGSSQGNATLSERRAKAVATYLMQRGVPETSLYYQGAGESLPIADNRTDQGRALNRRVEIVELADESGFKKYLESRKPLYAFYRKQEPATLEPTRPTDVSTQQAAKGTPQKLTPLINFGGTRYTQLSARIDTGALQPEKSLSFIAKAQAADDSVVLGDCTQDRPRAIGAVKSFRDGSNFKTTEHLPQLYGKTWASDVNSNLVVINHLAVLRGSGVPANLPELKVYAQYKPGSNQKPAVLEEPPVNSYLVEKGLLYRIFPHGEGGMRCLDILFGIDGATTAKAGKLIYSVEGDRYVTEFKPQIQ